MGCFTLGSDDKYIDSLINASVLCRSGFFQEQKGASSSPSCQAEGQEPGSKCSSNWTFTAVYAQVCVVITAAAASVVVVHRVLLSGGHVFCVSVHTCPATQGANGGNRGIYNSPVWRYSSEIILKSFTFFGTKLNHKFVDSYFFGILFESWFGLFIHQS